MVLWSTMWYTGVPCVTPEYHSKFLNIKAGVLNHPILSVPVVIFKADSGDALSNALRFISRRTSFVYFAFQSPTILWKVEQPRANCEEFPSVLAKCC